MRIIDVRGIIYIICRTCMLSIRTLCLLYVFADVVMAAEICIHVVCLQQGEEVLLQLAGVAVLPGGEHRVVARHQQPGGGIQSSLLQPRLDIS